MRRRPFGVAGLQQSAQRTEQLKSIGNQIAIAQIKQLQEQLSQFKSTLEKFAQKHRKAILKDPEFRDKFQQMCAMIGVDPLASSRGFWDDILGVGDFYYELGVQILELCLARGNAGEAGLMSITSLCEELRRSRMPSSSESGQKISAKDVERAIDMLNPLGRNAARVVRLYDKSFVTTQAPGISAASLRVRNYIVKNAEGCTAHDVALALGFNPALAEMYLLLLVEDGRLWIDTQTPEKGASEIETFRYCSLSPSAASSLSLIYS